ncbi:MAG: HmuY family protein [Polyangiaceae bacterium]
MKKLGFGLLGAWFLVGCGSDPLPSDAGAAGAAGSGNPGQFTSMCSAARATALGANDIVSTGHVTVLSSSAGVTTLYVDASAGGVTAAASNPWTFISLADGSKIEVTDLSSVESTAWDLALKRAQIYSNSGDGGPGEGSAALIDKDFDQVTSADAADASFSSESFFDSECTPNVQASTGALYTSFIDWYAYDEATHVLTPASGTYLVHGGTGKLYKLAFENYYATETGGTGMTGGAYLLKFKAL